MLFRNKRVLKQLSPIIKAINNGTLTCEYGATNLRNQPYKGLNALMLGYKAKHRNLPNTWALPTELSMCNYVLVAKPMSVQFGTFFKKCLRGQDINAPVSQIGNSQDVYTIRRYLNLYNVLDINGFEVPHVCKYSSDFCDKYKISSADKLIDFVAQECSCVPEQFKLITESIVYAYFASYCRINHSYPSIDLSVEEIYLNLEHSSKYAYNIASSLIESCIPDSKELARLHLSNIASLLQDANS
jgi:hypothetical protein